MSDASFIAETAQEQHKMTLGVLAMSVSAWITSYINLSYTSYIPEKLIQLALNYLATFLFANQTPGFDVFFILSFLPFSPSFQPSLPVCVSTKQRWPGETSPCFFFQANVSWKFSTSPFWLENARWGFPTGKKGISRILLAGLNGSTNQPSTLYAVISPKVQHHFLENKQTNNCC